MEICEALAALGATVDRLTDNEREQLDSLGYLAIPNVMSAATIAAIRARQAELIDAEGEFAGAEVHREAGTDRLSDLINKDPVYHLVITEPHVLAAVAYVLGGDVKLSSLNSRSALPGQGLQGLHPDWGRLKTPGRYQVCNSLWLLDDFTPHNGATRVVPGTHRTTRVPSDDMTDPTSAHPDEVLLQGRAGDVLVMNSHVWHGGTLNQSSKPRRVMHGYFCRRGVLQQLNQQKYLRQATWNMLSEAQRTVLGVTHRPAD